ncbi:hypothetical protein HELRODRAFT_195027 [Helobdella robusta]|uniref:Ras-GEF domain-containing protein n=1 Tax=Helobdella robusta TaxID=6412 RepID=T1FWN9_HELRO|nr:hypothetical protein HELRODRAFT_195027 [Helobdella robusta]ESO09754.1 hypothetical protein HELRODRAFT_195027 [Helobdella robusta]
MIMLRWFTDLITSRACMQWRLLKCLFELNLQFLKEEVTEDAIFCVNLKKVHFSDNSTDLNNEDEKKARLQWRLEEQRILKWGTLPKIVECMCQASGEINILFVDILLATYLKVTSEITGNKLYGEKLDRSLEKILLLWLDRYFDDFFEPPTFNSLSQLNSFVQSHFSDSQLARETKERMHICLMSESVEDDLMYGSMLDVVEWVWKTHLPVFSPPFDIFSIPPSYLAQQLTFIDSKLFGNVQAHHCLGSIWSQRNDKKLSTSSRPYSVLATVEHFNAVSYRVISTILKWPYATVTNRTVILEKWIVVAHECKKLKNFSSLKAIIAALQSNSVFRLKKVWLALSKERMDTYNELASIFNEENNQALLREILNKEGAVRCTTDSEHQPLTGDHDFNITGNANWVGGSRGRRWRQKMMMMMTRMNADKKSNTTLQKLEDSTRELDADALREAWWQPSLHSTIPYLGTLLTDLMMLDAAFVDVDHETKMFNMDKKRKEYEVLAQIQMLQSSSSSSSQPPSSFGSSSFIQPDPCFLDWFYSIRTYDDNESYELSLEIEPSNNSGTKEKALKNHKRNVSLGYFTIRRRGSMDDGNHLKNASSACCTTSAAAATAAAATTAAAAAAAGCGVLDEDRKSIQSLKEMSVLSKALTQQFDTLSMISKCTSMNNLLANQKPSSLHSPPSKTFHDQSNCIPVKVELIYNQSHSSNFYKTILVSNVDHVSTVMRKILSKFHIEDVSPDEFALSQKLENNSEIYLPDRGNVYYAIKSSSDVRLIARLKNQKVIKDHKSKSNSRGSSVIANNRRLIQRTNKLSKLFSSMVSLIPSS